MENPWDWSRQIAEGTYGHYDKEREEKEEAKKPQDEEEDRDDWKSQDAA